MNLFYTRLNKLGFKNYQEYLKSDYWEKAKKRYWDSKLTKECLAGLKKKKKPICSESLLLENILIGSQERFPVGFKM